MKGKKYILNFVLKPFYSLPTLCFNNRQREYALGHFLIAHTKTRYTILGPQKWKSAVKVSKLIPTATAGLIVYLKSNYQVQVKVI